MNLTPNSPEAEISHSERCFSGKIRRVRGYCQHSLMCRTAIREQKLKTFRDFQLCCGGGVQMQAPTVQRYYACGGG